ncbi:toll/interleukin-1 receptor domain-containing protein [Thiofilum flexile]|uniref:toll/interleukin-1 receptor domain-containing protein n=1 Tax=Thiofilum flexile TaxID=125627 RepID=UPI00036AB360|nr:toll/interleukin-1 receptor domain-containing protein [Thiofilum flexile]
MLKLGVLYFKGASVIYIKFCQIIFLFILSITSILAIDNFTYCLLNADGLYAKGDVLAAHDWYLQARQYATSNKKLRRTLPALAVTSIELGRRDENLQYLREFQRISLKNPDPWIIQHVKKYSITLPKDFYEIEKNPIFLNESYETENSPTLLMDSYEEEKDTNPPKNPNDVGKNTNPILIIITLIIIIIFISNANKKRRAATNSRIRKYFIILQSIIYSIFKTASRIIHLMKVVSNKPPVFISYSRKDIKFLNELKEHLTVYERRGLIEYWDDSKNQMGMMWRLEIEQALRSAKIAILLVSRPYLASKFIVKNELPPLLQSAKEHDTEIIPIMVSPCPYDISELGKIQASNSLLKPLRDMSPTERDVEYLKVLDRVAELLQEQ